MSTIRYGLIGAALNRAFISIDYNIHKDFHKNYELRKQIVLADNSLTEEEKTEAIRINNKDYDGANFLNWSSGNSEIDNLIRNCQSETLMPNVIIEWIPYDNLKYIKYLTRGGFSKIYTANWIDGRYKEWDSKEQQLIRFGTLDVILKELENVANASQRWFEEAESHLTISKKYPKVVQCFAPEVISGKEYTFKSDIYSIAMLMWEISFGQPPFLNYEHDCILAINIIDGMRPKIISEIPSKYKNLMEQCWNANPLERPDVKTLKNKIIEIKSYYQNNPNELPRLITKINEVSGNISSKVFTSKIHKFENLSKPKNATKEEQEGNVNKLYDFSISDNSSNLSKSSSNQYTLINFKDDEDDEDHNRESYRLFKKLKTENDVQDDNERETMQQQSNIGINNKVQNNLNFCSEEQDESELDEKF
ncbi:kinase-like domain-containing protein [Rhizophagus clarus]|uniref:Kinase-like domain-containing protein n=1 Tax=Rhizophagus clarus TaxID=94130 RepID=A0A8H3L594_9GLOM|nr:kinase-like domain-containing protein [Rhizophagus clarus]